MMRNPQPIGDGNKAFKAIKNFFFKKKTFIFKLFLEVCIDLFFFYIRKYYASFGL
jgi:hypothetical protein